MSLTVNVYLTVVLSCLAKDKHACHLYHESSCTSNIKKKSTQETTYINITATGIDWERSDIDVDRSEWGKQIGFQDVVVGVTGGGWAATSTSGRWGYGERGHATRDTLCQIIFIRMLVVMIVVIVWAQNAFNMFVFVFVYLSI